MILKTDKAELYYYILGTEVSAPYSLQALFVGAEEDSFRSPS